MDGFSLLNTADYTPAGLRSQREYDIGHAIGWLNREKCANTNYYLAGRLYVARSGWLLLSVPNALVRGVFDALTAPGAELPLAGAFDVEGTKPTLLNAHISVMTAEEVKKIGADNITERGHTFHYGIGPVREISPKNADKISRVWAIEVASPELAALRKSYGLTPLINGDHKFHITVAIRRTNVLRFNDINKFEAASGRGELKAAEFAARLIKEAYHGHKSDDQTDKTTAAHILSFLQTKESQKETRLKTGNAYVDQLGATPVAYNQGQSIWQNIGNHLGVVKQRGDMQIRAREGDERLKRYMDPAYAEQQVLASIRARRTGLPTMEELTRRHGDNMLQAAGINVDQVAPL